MSIPRAATSVVPHYLRVGHCRSRNIVVVEFLDYFQEQEMLHSREVILCQNFEEVEQHSVKGATLNLVRTQLSQEER